MAKQDLTGYSDSELSLIVLNYECLYNQRRRRASLIEMLRELFVFTDAQLDELNNDLDAEEE